jgi:hypothetical protein
VPEIPGDRPPFVPVDDRAVVADQQREFKDPHAGFVQRLKLNRSRQQVAPHHRRMRPEFIRLSRFGPWAWARLKGIRAAHHQPNVGLSAGI